MDKGLEPNRTSYYDPESEDKQKEYNILSFDDWGANNPSNLHTVPSIPQMIPSGILVPSSTIIWDIIPYKLCNDVIFPLACPHNWSLITPYDLILQNSQWTRLVHAAWERDNILSEVSRPIYISLPSNNSFCDPFPIQPGGLEKKFFSSEESEIMLKVGKKSENYRNKALSIR